MSDLIVDDFSAYNSGVTPSGYTQNGGGAGLWLTADVGGSGSQYRLLECAGASSVSAEYSFIRNSPSVTNIIIETKIVFKDTIADWAGLAIGFSAANSAGAKYYFLEGSPYYNKWQITDADGENRVSYDLTIDPDIDYWIRLRAVGTTLSAYFSYNGEFYFPLGAISDWTMENGYDGGYVGFVSRGFSPPHVYFDNFYVYDSQSYGIKIAKSGHDATDVPTNATKKNYTILSTEGVHKVSTQAVITSDTNVTHGLGFRPFFDAYILTNSLTRAHPIKSGFSSGEAIAASSWDASCDATYLYCDELSGSDSLFYIIYLDQP